MRTEIKKRSALLLVICCLLSVFAAVMFGSVQPKAQAAGETFQIVGAGVRTEDPTGIRFSTEVNKSYLSGIDGEYSFGTLVIPKDLLGSGELTHETPLVDDVKQTTWGKETDTVKTFNAVIYGIPETEFDRELVARSYVIINNGTPIYSSETVTRSVGQVAATHLKNYPEEANATLNAYVEKSVKNVTLPETLTLDINGYDTLVATTNPLGYDVTFTSDTPSIATVDANGKVTGVAEGTAKITAQIATLTAVCNVTVTDAIVDTLDSYESLGTWVSNNGATNNTCQRELVVEEDGNKYAKFYFTGKNNFINFNIGNVPAQFQTVGSDYIVTFDMWSEDTLDSLITVIYPNGVTNTSAETPVTEIDGVLNSTTSKTTASMRFEVNSDKRLRTFRVYNNCSNAVSFCIDNVKYTPVKDVYMISTAEQVIVTPETELTLTPALLKMRHVVGDLSYKVYYNGLNEVALKDNKFTTADNGYYVVDVTATVGSNSITKTVKLFFVEGAKVMNFDDMSSLAGTWVANSISGKTTNKSLAEDDNGGKCFKLNTNSSKVTFNIPAPTGVETSKKYDVYFRCWTNAEFTQQYSYIELTGGGDIYDCDGTLTMYSKDEVFHLVDTVTYDNGLKQNRFSTFYINISNVRNSSTDTFVDFYIDDIVFIPRTELFAVANKDVVVNANTTFALNETNLGLSGVADGATLSYEVTYTSPSGISTVDASSGAFTTGANGYYTVLVSATKDEQVYTRQITLVVNGTLVWTLTDATRTTGYVVNDVNSELHIDYKGNSSYRVISASDTKFNTNSAKKQTYVGGTIDKTKTYKVYFEVYTLDTLSENETISLSINNNTPIALSATQNRVIGSYDMSSSAISEGGTIAFTLYNKNGKTISYCIDNFMLIPNA